MASDMFDPDSGKSEASMVRKAARVARRGSSAQNNFGDKLGSAISRITPQKKTKKSFVTKPSAGGRIKEPNQGLGPSARGIAASMGKAGGRGKYDRMNPSPGNRTLGAISNKGGGRPFEMPQIGDKPTGFTGMPKGWSPWGAGQRIDQTPNVSYQPEGQMQGRPDMNSLIQNLLRSRGRAGATGFAGNIGNAVGGIGRMFGGGRSRGQGFGNTMFGGRGNAPDQYGGGQRPPSMMMNRTQAIPSMMMNRGMGTPGPGMSGNMMNRSQFTPAPNRMGRMF